MLLLLELNQASTCWIRKITHYITVLAEKERFDGANVSLNAGLDIFSLRDLLGLRKQEERNDVCGAARGNVSPTDLLLLSVASGMQLVCTTVKSTVQQITPGLLLILQ